MDIAPTPLRQLLYVSSSNSTDGTVDVAQVVEQSRRNNALDGVTGLLWSDGRRFLQVLEGPEDSIASTFDRIKGDRRHRAIVVLQDRVIPEREFGGWTMAQRRAEDSADTFDVRMRRSLERASESIRGSFLGLISVRA